MSDVGHSCDWRRLAGAVLGAALLSVAASPNSHADEYAVVPVSEETNLVTLPYIQDWLSYTMTTENLAVYDTTTDTEVTGAGAGSETLTENVYVTPLVTYETTDITSATGTLAANEGYSDNVLWLAPGSADIVGFETNPAEILTPFGDFPVPIL